MKKRSPKIITGKTIVLASGKGGVGKSTIARALAGYWLSLGQKCALVDADPQGSIINLHDADGPMRKATVVADAEVETIRVTMAELGSTHDIVIVDTAGFRNQTTIAACVEADVVVVPLKPAAEDMREAIAMVQLIAELNGTPERSGRPIKAVLVLAMVTPGTLIGRQVRKELEKAGFPLLESEVAQRVAFPELSMRGLAPSLVEPDGAAARDIGRLAGELNELWRNGHVKAA